MALDIKHAVTEKLGPFPAWAWVGLGVGAYLLYKHFKGGSTSNANNSIGYTQSYVPATSAGGSGTSGTPVSLSCPAGQQLDPTGTFCVPNTSLCGPGTSWQNGQCITSPPTTGNQVCTVACMNGDIGAPWPICCIPNPAIAACQAAGGTWANGSCSFSTPVTSPPPPVNNPPPPTNNPPPVNNPPPTGGGGPCAGQTGLQALLCQAAQVGSTQGVCNPGYIQFAGSCIPTLSSLPVYPVGNQGLPGCCITSFLNPQAPCDPGITCPGAQLASGFSKAGPVSSGVQNSGSLSSASTFTPASGTPTGAIVGGPGPGVQYIGGQWVQIA